MLKTGIIYNIDIKNRILSLNIGKRLVFFYISKGLYKKFKNYLYKGNYISFSYDENSLSIKNNTNCYSISYFKEISVPGRYGKDILYSKKDIKEETKKFLDKLNYKLFIDIEMSMPEYKSYGYFLNEMIQVGFILVDNLDNVILEYNNYIKLTHNKFLSLRTTDFMHIDYEYLLDNGIDYIDFYNYYKGILETYNPAVIVFGKNDKKFLESSFQTNNVPSLNSKTRFINISQLLKTYYELPSEPGLVKIYEKMYNVKEESQKHNAFSDAYYTYYVYKKFKSDVN